MQGELVESVADNHLSSSMALSRKTGCIKIWSLPLPRSGLHLRIYPPFHHSGTNASSAAGGATRPRAQSLGMYISGRVWCVKYALNMFRVFNILLNTAIHLGSVFICEGLHVSFGCVYSP